MYLTSLIVVVIICTIDTNNSKSNNIHKLYVKKDIESKLDSICTGS